jgi:hypothetical protein
VVREALRGAGAAPGAALSADLAGRFADHRAAVDGFLAAAEGVDAARWATRPDAAKWSPGQVVEHVLLTYEAMLRELQGGVGMRLRANWWRRLVIRLRYLPAVLNEGRLPDGAPAVREIRPGDVVREKQDLLLCFRERAAQFDETIGAAHHRGGGKLTHPFFGRLGTAEALALLTAHTEHHRKQLPRGALGA